MKPNQYLSIAIILLLIGLLIKSYYRNKDLQDGHFWSCVDREERLYRNGLINCIDNCRLRDLVYDNYLFVNVEGEGRSECYCVEER